MLNEAVAYATIPADDFDRAKQFYSEKLGFEPVEETPGGAFYEPAGGGRFLLFPSGGSASGTHTQLGFAVDDIEAAVSGLRSRGVEFEEYETPKTENGIASVGAGRAAWFKDSEGNLFGVIQFS